jgi:hypothetical protein
VLDRGEPLDLHCGTCGFAVFPPTFTRSSRCEAAVDQGGAGAS